MITYSADISDLIVQNDKAVFKTMEISDWTVLGGQLVSVSVEPYGVDTSYDVGRVFLDIGRLDHGILSARPFRGRVLLTVKNGLRRRWILTERFEYLED